MTNAEPVAGWPGARTCTYTKPGTTSGAPAAPTRSGGGETRTLVTRPPRGAKKEKGCAYCPKTCTRSPPLNPVISIASPSAAMGETRT